MGLRLGPCYAYRQAEPARGVDEAVPQPTGPAVQGRVEVEAAEQHQHVERWVPHGRAVLEGAERELDPPTHTLAAAAAFFIVALLTWRPHTHVLGCVPIRGASTAHAPLRRKRLRAILVQEGLQVPEHLASHFGGQLEPLVAQQARVFRGVGEALGLVAALEVDDDAGGDLELPCYLPLEVAP